MSPRGGRHAGDHVTPAGFAAEMVELQATLLPQDPHPDPPAPSGPSSVPAIVAPAAPAVPVAAPSPYARPTPPPPTPAPAPAAAAAPRDPYIRGVVPTRVIDGDTFVCEVDLGFFVWVRMSCRLAGVNTNELNEAGGPQAKAELERVLALGDVTAASVHADKYAGRFDARVYVRVGGDVVDVAAYLIGQGYAVAWDGRGPKPRVPWPRPAPPGPPPLGGGGRPAPPPASFDRLLGGR